MKIKKSTLCISLIIVVIVILTVLGVYLKMEKKKTDLQEVSNGFHSELFGENVYIFSPDDNPEDIQAILDDLWDEQEANQFGTSRYSIYFMPGVYDESLEVNLGFYMQVAGLGTLPTDTVIPSLQCSATWLDPTSSNHNACCNFWRGVENIELGSNTMLFHRQLL